MLVDVRLFAGLRERAGMDRISLELPDGACVQDALARLQELTAGVSVVLAVNQQYAGADHELHPGDEIAVIPPVSGGAEASVHVGVSSDPLELTALAARVRDPRAGAVVTFTGVTREVDELEYEAYVPMAERMITEIVAAALSSYALCAAAAEHRIGRVPLSEPSVAVAVSAPHRGEAFAGARQIIDRIKAEVPIWKREAGRWATGTTPA